VESQTPVRFADLGLSAQTLEALEYVGYEHPSPIQQQLIPIALTGVDCTGQARTGTGKTAAFGLPILERIAPDFRRPQALVLAPTRELSEQVAAEIRRLANNRPVKAAVVVGGKPMGRQVSDLRDGAQIVIGTPGRIIDLIQRGELHLDHVSIVVLDEADRMLDIGFRPDIERILKRCPTERQTLLLSATMPEPVERLARRYMRNPQRVDLSQDQVDASGVEQFYCTVDEHRKFGLLVKILIAERPQQALVFMRTKRGADRLYARFAGRLPHVALIHGDLPQSKRDQVMQDFRSGEIRLLIATDVVGRGIDVSGISHIVNYDVPEYCDDYVHRVGRTGRLSSDEPGKAFTFVTKDQGDQLTAIEIRINRMLPEYKVPDFDAFAPRTRRVHAEQPSEQPVELGEFQIA
jgi:ATP-dependent RNA helicase DeaD